MKLTGEERVFYYLWLALFLGLALGVGVLVVYSMFARERHF